LQRWRAGSRFLLLGFRRQIQRRRARERQARSSRKARGFCGTAKGCFRRMVGWQPSVSSVSRLRYWQRCCRRLSSVVYWNCGRRGPSCYDRNRVTPAATTLTALGHICHRRVPAPATWSKDITLLALNTRPTRPARSAKSVPKAGSLQKRESPMIPSIATTTLKYRCLWRLALSDAWQLRQAL